MNTFYMVAFNVFLWGLTLYLTNDWLISRGY